MMGAACTSSRNRRTKYPHARPCPRRRLLRWIVDATVTVAFQLSPQANHDDWWWDAVAASLWVALVRFSIFFLSRL
jgi:hypothetical protein